MAPVNGLTPDWPAKIAKRLGATKMASISYSASPSGTASVEAVQKYAAPAFGLENAYINTTLEFGTEDVGPIVLGIKNSGADGLYLPLDNDTNVAIVQGLAAERREDEGQRARHRLQPGPARPARRRRS